MLRGINANDGHAEYITLLTYHTEAEENGRHLPDAIFKCIFLNENVYILTEIPLKFVLKGPIKNIPALVQINGLAPSKRQAIICTNGC